MPTISLLTNTTLSTTAVLIGDSPPPARMRTIYDIIWSCLTTILACTWTAVHPNVNPEVLFFEPKLAFNTRYVIAVFRKHRYRLCLRLIALFIPEIIVLWAIQQRLAARSLAQQYRAQGWTQTHAFLAIMGGLLYKHDKNVPDTRGAIASPYLDPLKTLITNGKVTIPIEDIHDKSKGSFLLKVIVLIQTTWFVVQFFARVGNGLRISELELVTIAYASLNFAIHFLWWNKPVNIERPFRVYPDGLHDHPDASVATEQPRPEEHCAPLLTVPSVGPSGADRPNTAESEVKDRSHAKEGSSASVVAIPREDRIENVESAAKNTPRYLVELFRKLMMGYETPDDITGFCTGVCVTFPGKPTMSQEQLSFAFSSALTSAFGAAHLAAWSFGFPSGNHQSLWRFLAVMITAIPIYGVVLSMLYHHRKVHFSAQDEAILFIPMTLLFLLAYVVARGILLVEVFILLFRADTEVFRAIPWTNYIPHF